MTEPFDDTIAAISTAAGRAAVALLRISGPAAGDILLALTPRLHGRLPAPRVQTLATIHHPQSDEALDQVLVTWFPAPGSYTGEDVVEVATHGGSLTPQLVLNATLVAGARLALPGEFTHRAHINGKLDLLQAEAVLDLIDGRSRALHRAAIHQLDRGLSYRIDRLREAVLQVEALSIYSIDFPEEDEPPVPPERIRSAAVEARERIDALLQTARQGELLREGALVVLAGEPNSGKSSLFNALLGVDRAIVTEVPGTTRDAIEAFVELRGFPFRLVDTAGLRSTSDKVEAIGIEVARRYLAAADLVLFCVPASRELNAAELDFLNTLPAERVIVAATMSDVGGLGSTLSFPDRPAVTVSALHGSGLGELGELLVERAYHQIRHGADDASIITRERHARALQQARDEVETFIAAIDGEEPLEIAATHLRSAAGALEEIVGVLSPDDVLGQLFSEFCVGK